MEIRQVRRYVYDVFLFNGWENWSRVRKGRSYVSLVDGNRLPHAVLKQLNVILNEKPELAPGNRFEVNIEE
jgi:hypothetical protein